MLAISFSVYYNNHFCRLLPLCHIVYNRAKTSSGIVSRKLEEPRIVVNMGLYFPAEINAKGLLPVQQSLVLRYGGRRKLKHFRPPARFAASKSLNSLKSLVALSQLISVVFLCPLYILRKEKSIVFFNDQTIICRPPAHPPAAPGN